uniref:Uncharacterized protein n=1 Tax=Mimivirus LCMiAC02 TaxID=2506609 RepID=A0A4P6VQ43_9VIRU|nr:MAG: hypothetical protein LCMiAC02_04890 [Mimivirus LCMiAC02]
MKEFIIAIVVALLILSLLGQPSAEGFTLTTGRRHAVMDDFNILMYVSNKEPCKIGDHSCYIVPCPTTNEKDILCWKCESRQHKPQLE